jgi:hypothetical protein
MSRGIQKYVPYCSARCWPQNWRLSKTCILVTDESGLQWPVTHVVVAPGFAYKVVMVAVARDWHVLFVCQRAVRTGRIHPYRIAVALEFQPPDSREELLTVNGFKSLWHLGRDMLVSPVGIRQVAGYVCVCCCRSSCYSWGVRPSTGCCGVVCSVTSGAGSIFFPTNIHTDIYLDIFQ